MVRVGGYDPMEVDDLIDEIESGLASEPPGISAQQITSVAFTSARRSGYACKEVDAWLDLVMAELRRRAGGPVAAERPPYSPPGFATPVPPTGIADRPHSSAVAAGGDSRIVSQRAGGMRWVAMLVIAVVAVAVIVALYLSGVFG